MSKKRFGAKQELANAKELFDNLHFASIDFFDLAEEFGDKWGEIMKSINCLNILEEYEEAYMAHIINKNKKQLHWINESAHNYFGSEA